MAVFKFFPEEIYYYVPGVINFLLCLQLCEGTQVWQEKQLPQPEAWRNSSEMCIWNTSTATLQNMC
jgi:hypothetical protein